MPLLVNLRHLEKKPLHLEGELTADELDIQSIDELIRTPLPLTYNISVESLDQNLLAQGELKLELQCECSRCLKQFTQTIQIPQWAAHIPLEGEDRAEVKNDLVDLTPYIREDIVLAFPQRPLCEEGCEGLAGASEAQAEKPREDESASTWSELDKLKF